MVIRPKPCQSVSCRLSAHKQGPILAGLDETRDARQSRWAELEKVKCKCNANQWLDIRLILCPFGFQIRDHENPTSAAGRWDAYAVLSIVIGPTAFIFSALFICFIYLHTLTPLQCTLSQWGVPRGVLLERSWGRRISSDDTTNGDGSTCTESTFRYKLRYKSKIEAKRQPSMVRSMHNTRTAVGEPRRAKSQDEHRRKSRDDEASVGTMRLDNCLGR